MSIHFGVALGPVDAITRIRVNEKVAWEGRQTANGVLEINKPDLFGGVTKEGGLQGRVHFLMGGPDQLLSADLAARLGDEPENLPGYRGFTSLWFAGSSASRTYRVFGAALSTADQVEGFHWSDNNPIIAQSIAVTAERSPKGLNPAYAMIGSDANPMHIVYECMRNSDWGMGAPESQFDLPIWNSAAHTLYLEQFGLSLIWARQSTIQAFVQEVLDHIQCTLFVDPGTGKWTPKLLRDDYDVEDLPRISPDNAVVTNFQRRFWGETTNEITVTWTNPENEEEQTVTVQDIANVAIQGAPVADNRNYYGVRNAPLAERLAFRDLRAASAPLAGADASLNRSFWRVRPGDPLLLDWPEEGVSGMVVRAGEVNYGRSTSGEIKVDLMEDIFSLARPAPGTPPPASEWTDPAEPPEPVADWAIFTLPAFFSAGAILQPAAVPLEYPEVLAGVLAYQTGYDTLNFDLIGEGVTPDGETVLAPSGTKTTTERALLDQPLAAEALSLLPRGIVLNPDRAPVGSFVFIGRQDEEMEICLLQDAVDDDYVLVRGLLDTVPRDWPSGTPLWFLQTGDRVVDDRTIRAAGESPRYKLLTRTSKGRLDIEDAAWIQETLTARPHLPLRPANVAVNGDDFGVHVLPGGTTEIVVSWSTRNRFFEDGQVLAWTDGPAAPEYRQETVVRVLETGGDEIVVYRGLWTETTLTLQSAWFARWSAIDIEVSSRRDELWSLQSHTIRVTGLAGDPGAPAPPNPPAITPPPEPVGPPQGAAFSVVATELPTTEGGTIPAIVIAGQQDNPDAVELLIRFARVMEGGIEADWSYAPSWALNRQKVRVPITNGIAPQTRYEVQISYRLASNLPSKWLSLGEHVTGALDVSFVGGRRANEIASAVDQIEAIGQGKLEDAAAIIADLKEYTAAALFDIAGHTNAIRESLEKAAYIDGKRVGAFAKEGLTELADGQRAIAESLTELGVVYDDKLATAIEVLRVEANHERAQADYYRGLQAQTNLGFDTSIETLEQVYSDPDTGLAVRTSTLETALNTPETGVLARIEEVEQVYGDPETGLASRTSTLEAALNTPETGVLARIEDVEQVYSDPETGLAVRTSTLEATLNTADTGLVARVEEAEGALVDASGKLAAWWEVEVVAGGRATIAARATEAGGAVDIAADTFVVRNPVDGSLIPVLAVTGGIAEILNARIRKAQIDELIITTGDIGEKMISDMLINVASAVEYGTGGEVIIFEQVMNFSYPADIVIQGEVAFKDGGGNPEGYHESSLRIMINDEEANKNEGRGQTATVTLPITAARRLPIGTHNIKLIGRTKPDDYYTYRTLISKWTFR